MKFRPCLSVRLTIYRNSEEVTALNCFIYPLYNHRANKALWYIMVISDSKMSSAHVYLSYTTRLISLLVFSYLCTDHILSESFWLKKMYYCLSILKFPLFDFLPKISLHHVKQRYLCANNTEIDKRNLESNNVLMKK